MLRYHCCVSPFYFCLHRPLPALIAFPTRRSSDLARSPARGSRGRATSTRTASTTSPSARRPASPSTKEARAASKRRRRRRSRRSEEHTSELQSLRHLVCRLLLEKKNPKPRRPRQY